MLDISVPSAHELQAATLHLRHHHKGSAPFQSIRMLHVTVIWWSLQNNVLVSVKFRKRVSHIHLTPRGRLFPTPPHPTPPIFARGKLARWKGFWPSWHGSVENFTTKESGWHDQNPSAAAIANRGQVSCSMSINHSPPGLATVDGHCRDPRFHQELPNDFPIPPFLLLHLLEVYQYQLVSTDYRWPWNARQQAMVMVLAGGWVAWTKVIAVMIKNT